MIQRNSCEFKTASLPLNLGFLVALIQGSFQLLLWHLFDYPQCLLNCLWEEKMLIDSQKWLKSWVLPHGSAFNHLSTKCLSWPVAGFCIWEMK